MGRISKAIIIIILSIISLETYSQTDCVERDKCDIWVDSVYNSLTQTQRIGQLMMVRCFSNQTESFYDEVSRQIKEYNIGGICFFQGSPESQIALVNRFQSEAQTPLLISQDAEWGPAMRFRDHCVSFPKQMTLGAITNDSLIYEMGASIAQQLKSIGVNVSFSPVVDINNNPMNPVINYRSFGESKENVARKGIMYMKGLQDNNILAIAKHFPGHGDTDTDSHYDLPVISHTYAHVDSVELYPFKELIKAGVSGIMNAHIYFPLIDNTKNIPSSLSEKIVTGILRDSLNFKGITYSDGLEMKAIFKYAEPGEVEAYSLKAGNDIQLLPVDIDKSMKTINQWINDGRIEQRQLEEACRRVLKSKYYLLQDIHEIDDSNVQYSLNSDEDKALIRELYRNSITAIKNDKEALPLRVDNGEEIACIIVSNKHIETLETSFGRYKDIDFHYIECKADKKQCTDIELVAENYKKVVVIINSSSNSIKSKFELSDDVYKLINMLSYRPSSVLCIIANPYLASNIENIDNYNAVVFGYETTEAVYDILPQSLYGAYPITGRLPVSINKQYQVLSGIDIEESGTISYPSAEEIKVRYGDFAKVDSIVNFGIGIKAYPGCQIFVVHEGNVIIDKAYGHLTYNQREEVDTETMYDVASLTKIAATTMSIMDLENKNMINIDAPLSTYLPFLNQSNKSKLIIRDIMSHSTGLIPYINFYKAFSDSKFRKNNIQDDISDDFTVKIAKDKYISKDWEYFIFDSIAKTNFVSEEKMPPNRYIYSDLGFILLRKAIENITNQPIDRYVMDTFYKPLGLQRTTYLPNDRLSTTNIAPTQNDKVFRKQLLKGYVHDEAAALLGGVSGHAGLFSTAEEIGIIMQMIMQEGIYNGKRFFNSRIVKDFTAAQYPEINNRRGIGFDKPNIENTEEGPVCTMASQSSFGHSGFTGCLAWADPEKQLVYVFLSNRICPNAENTKLTKYNIRSDIHKAIYEAIETQNTDIE